MRKLTNCTAYLIVLILSVCLIYYGNQFIKHHQVNRGLNMNYEEEMEAQIFAEVISLDLETDEESEKKVVFTAMPFGYVKGQSGSVRAC